MESEDPIDWDRASAKAAWLGWDAMLALTLGACRALLDTPVPSGVPLRAPPRWLSLFPAVPSSPGVLARALFPLRALGRPSWKLRYLAHLLFVPTLTERRAFALPRPLAFLYHVVRPARLGFKWGGALARMVRGNPAADGSRRGRRSGPR